jgi:hypothetical protein
LKDNIIDFRKAKENLFEKFKEELPLPKFDDYVHISRLKNIPKRNKKRNKEK